MSRSEIAKAAGSIGAASGLFRSRFLSQSLIATRSSRNAALHERLKKLVALRRVEPLPSLPASPQPDRCAASRVPFESGLGKRNYENKKPKYSQ